MWTIQRLQPDRPMQQISFAVRVRGPLDVAALREALAAVTARHEALRSRFEVRGTALHQVVEDSIELPFTELPAGDPDPIAPLREAMSTPIRLDVAPVWRAMLLRLADDHVFGFQVHHTVVDGEGIRLLQDELGELYRAAVDGDEPALGQASSWLAHLDARHRYTTTAEYQSEVAYWQGVVTGLVPPTRLPVSAPTTPGPIGRCSDTPDRVLDNAVLSGLRALGERHRATMTMVVTGCLAAAVAQVSGAPSVGVRMSYAGHRWAGAETTLGMSVSTLPVVCHAGTDVDEAIIEAREQVVAGVDASAVSFEDFVVSDDVYWPDAYHVGLDLAEGRLPVSGLRLVGTTCEGFDVGHAQSRFTPALGALVKEDELRLWMSYDITTYTAADAEHLLDVISTVLTEAPGRSAR